MSEGAAAAEGTTISVHCKCGKKLKAPASAVGRKAKCPKCGNILIVEAPPPAPADELDDALYELGGQEQAAATQQSAATICPSCRAAMAAGAVLCTSCGYDTRTGKKLGTEKASVAAAAPRPAAVGTRYIPPAAQPKQMASTAPSGSLVKGTIISGVCAFVGALIWYVIAKATGLEIGWIAWGVGFAAGAGMMAGYNGTSVHSGSIAAAMAVVGILVGKFMVFTWVAVPMMTKMVDDMMLKIGDEKILNVFVANQEMQKAGIDPGEASDAQRQKFSVAAQTIIAKMDEATKKASVQKGIELLKEKGREVMGAKQGSLFAKTMFAPIDILFVVLAVASAFKVATFGGQVES